VLDHDPFAEAKGTTGGTRINGIDAQEIILSDL
jgi:hypothetical protein